MPRSRLLLTLAPLLALAAGCSKKPQAASLAGQVRYKGRPVVYGQVQFMQGGRAVGKGEIQDGQYSAAGLPPGDLDVVVLTRVPLPLAGQPFAPGQGPPMPFPTPPEPGDGPGKADKDKADEVADKDRADKDRADKGAFPPMPPHLPGPGPAGPPHLPEFPEETQKFLDEVQQKFGDPADVRLTIKVEPGHQTRDLELPD
jgi:hypothetical protein